VQARVYSFSKDGSGISQDGQDFQDLPAATKKSARLNLAAKLCILKTLSIL
jgi:hypothetical protein